MPQDFKKLMEDNFGANLTGAQLWALTKFAKNVRFRCRNNAAFNNFMNATFPNASFRQVTKTRINRSGLPESYSGLQIIMKDGAVLNSEEEGEE
jgi:hypothetical protein